MDAPGLPRRPLGGLVRLIRSGCRSARHRHGPDAGQGAALSREVAGLESRLCDSGQAPGAEMTGPCAREGCNRAVARCWYNRGYPRDVKTAISLPDHVFEAAEQLARGLGKSRSELYSAAIASYLEQHRQDEATERLNEVYGPQEEPAELDPLLAMLQSLSVAEEDW